MTGEELLAAASAAHADAREHEAAAEAARVQRDELVKQAIEAGVTANRVATTLGVAATTPKIWVRAAERRREP